jgi:hypothetical protein
VLAATASAQERKGFWFDFGVGVGSSGISTGIDEARDSAGIVALKLGWALNRQLLMGMEIRMMTLDVTGDIVGVLAAYNVHGTILYYPRASSGFFLSGGLGGAFLDLDPDDQDLTNVAKGFGLSAGVGYDFYLGRGFSLTPATTFWYGNTGGGSLNAQTSLADWNHNVIDATISIKFN